MTAAGGTEQAEYKGERTALEVGTCSTIAGERRVCRQS